MIEILTKKITTKHMRKITKWVFSVQIMNMWKYLSQTSCDVSHVNCLKWHAYWPKLLSTVNWLFQIGYVTLRRFICTIEKLFFTVKNAKATVKKYFKKIFTKLCFKSMNYFSLHEIAKVTLPFRYRSISSRTHFTAKGPNWHNSKYITNFSTISHVKFNTKNKENKHEFYLKNSFPSWRWLLVGKS